MGSPFDFLGGMGGGMPGGGPGSIPFIGDLFGGGGGGAPAAAPKYGGAYPGYPQTQANSYPGYPVPIAKPAPTYSFEGDFSKPGQAEGYYAQHMGDMGKPSAASGFWGENKDKFGAPGQGQQFWNQAQGMFNEHKASPVSQNAQGAYDQFQGSAPANTGAYYDQAAKKAQAGIMAAAAASGLGGSSAVTNQVGDMQAGIRGQQALADANYGLQRGQIAGQLASGADRSSQAASQDQLGWLGGLGSLANQNDAFGLQNRMAGMNAASEVDQRGLAELMAGMTMAQAAQAAQRARGQDYFGNQLELGKTGAGITGLTYQQMLEQDQALTQAQRDSAMGLPREQLTQSLNGRNSSEEGIGNFVGLAGKFMKGGV